MYRFNFLSHDLERLQLLWLSLILAYSVFRYGAVLPTDRYICFLALGLLALRGTSTLRLPWLLPLLSYPLLQLLPLPIPLLRIISPAHAELHGALSPVMSSSFTSLSVMPYATFDHFLRLCAYAVIFLLARELAADRPWRAVFPIVLIAALEAALGMWQWAAGAPVHGTYVNRNHFAGLLEMSLPFTVMYAVLRASRRLSSSLKSVLALTISTLILLAIIYSLSRMGFISALCGLCVLCGFLWRPRYLLILPLIALLAFIFLPPDQLIARFAGLVATEELSADTRLRVWSETLHLIAAYPIFGCGLGGYESAFLNHKAAAPLNTVDYAHNDYLQGLAELGILGFALFIVFLVIIFRRVGQAVSSPNRYFSIACIASISAILIHSLTDFNLHIPANAMVLAWISGVAVARASARGPAPWPPSVPRVIDVTPTSTGGT